MNDQVPRPRMVARVWRAKGEHDKDAGSRNSRAISPTEEAVRRSPAAARTGRPSVDGALGPQSRRAALSRTAIALAWLAATAGVIAIMLIAASSTEAGIYKAAQCHPGLGAGHPDLGFRRTSRGYRGSAACVAGAGLGIEHAAERAGGGRLGAWIMRTPPGLDLLRAGLWVAGDAANGHVPELIASSPGRSPRRFGRAAGRFHRVRLAGDASRIEVRLRCVRSRGCGPGRDARVAVRRLVFRLVDTHAPQLELRGPLVGGVTQRGGSPLEAIASDSGAGVRSVVVEVNGEPLATTGFRCQLRRGIAVRLRPCPARDTAALTARTAAAPFRQGPNTLLACALDFTRKARANHACETRRIRVDNACPVSGERLDASLRTSLHRRNGRLRLRGRLVDESGSGISGAEVCIATRVRLPNTTERVVASPATAGGGRFKTILPRGPNREVRVAYWADTERVVERYEDARAKARPRLRVRPRRPFRNGQRAHFLVTLQGPARTQRRLTLKVRSDGRWLPLRQGRTDRRGRWSTSYRFRSTTGERTYRFAVFVPRQPGYPYMRGRSAVRRVRVVG
jgi:hypothetical protein